MWVPALSATRAIARGSLLLRDMNTNFTKSSLLCHSFKRMYSLAGGDTSRDEGKTTVTMLNQERDVLLIDSYNEFGFRLNTGIFIVGPMVIFPKTVLQWNIKSAAHIDGPSLSILKVLCPAIDVVVVSLGEKDPDIESKMTKLLISHKVNFEILPVFQACTTFNFLNAEHRYVAGFFIPPKTSDIRIVKELGLQKERKELLAEIDEK